ncbi:MAG TPA: hypothetical protein VG755_17350 [Nannocystaceae bacterium]|nr:hypothetical protein [Nannocystaceae bacterium]
MVAVRSDALPPDVIARLDRTFVRDGDRVRARELLSAMQAQLGAGDFARVIRCVVHLADGDLATLAEMTAAACLDWRDVIMWAEYAPGGRRIHDFTTPFE